LESAQAVTGVTLTELRSLVDKSMVQHTLPERFTLQELLRQYAAEALERSASLYDQAHDRHCAWFTAALKGYAAQFQTPVGDLAFKELVVEIENARAAWIWMVAHLQAERMAQAIYALGYFFSCTQRRQEGITLCNMAAEKLIPLLDSPLTFAEAAGTLAQIWTWQFLMSGLQDSNEADRLAGQCQALLDRAEEAGVDVRSERALFLLWRGCFARKIETIRETFARSRELYLELGDQGQAALPLVFWGETAASMGEYAEARQVLEQFLAEQTAQGRVTGLARAHNWLAWCAWSEGNLDEAEAWMQENLTLRETKGNSAAIAGGKAELAKIFVRQGKYAEAKALIEEGISFFDAEVDSSSCSHILFLAEAEVHLGLYAQAYQRALEIQSIVQDRMAGYHWAIAFSCYLTGLAELGLGESDHARHDLAESIRIFRERQFTPVILGWALSGLAYAERRLGNRQAAWEHLREAIGIGMDKDIFWVFIYVLPTAALLLADQGENAQAVELYALALRYAIISNSRWFEDVAGREIAALAASLPLEVAAAAQERGRRRDLQETALELLVEIERVRSQSTAIETANKASKHEIDN
jgi:tetratricopeptide (TPR) repeat protein